MSEVFKIKFSVEELEKARRIVFESDPWTEERVDEATRGWVMGACADPWPVGLKVWIEINRLSLSEEEFLEYQLNLLEVLNMGGEKVRKLALLNQDCGDEKLKFYNR